MDKNLEQGKSAEELPVTTPSKEEQVVKETPKTEEPTSDETHEEELARIKEEYEVRLKEATVTTEKRVSGIQGLKDTAEKGSKFATEQLQKTQKELERLRDKRFELEEKLAASSDDPESARKAISLMRKAEEMDGKIKEREVELDRREFEAWQWSMSRKAEALQAEYGVPIEELFKARDERDMELVAYKFALAKKPEEKKAEVKLESEEGTPEFDLSVSSGTAKSYKQAEKDYAEGKISFAEYSEARKKRGLD